MHTVRSTLSTLRDRFAPITHTSTFLQTGQLTPEEFLQAGDYLVSKFPSWTWADASPVSRRVTYLPAGKQFLVTRGVPCRRRLDENFAGGLGGDLMVSGRDEDEGGDEGDGEEGWLRTGGPPGRGSTVGDVRTVSDSGRLQGEKEMSALQLEEQRESEIPDMEEDDDDEAIIRDPAANTAAASGGATGGNPADEPMRTYTLHITYTPYYRTPRLYLSGYTSQFTPLPPIAMMEDIVGDYKDKTVTFEDFPFFEPGLKMASVHPCRHASVMKTLLDRANNALIIRKQRIAAATASNQGISSKSGAEAIQKAKVESGMEGLVDDRDAVTTAAEAKFKAGVRAAGGHEGDEWEVLEGAEDNAGEEESAIRVDQYLVVFLKFMASVTPGIEHDFTMSL